MANPSIPNLVAIGMCAVLLFPVALTLLIALLFARCPSREDKI